MALQPHFEFLKNKWTKRHKKLQEKIWAKHGESLAWFSNNTKHLTAGTAMAGLVLLGNPLHIPLPVPHQLLASENGNQTIDKNIFLVSDLSTLLPDEVRSLTTDEEQKISEILTRDFGIKAQAELDGKRLNRSYGLIGAEQHLTRFPGDTLNSHFSSQEEAEQFGASGMAPGRGAWGYFANSATEMTKKDIDREKYYIAVQTFLAPDFLSRVSEYRDFFKFRKMLVVNPQTGRAVVAVIGDAGPAEWTGKHLGGSPEVMKYLERKDGKQKGAVLYFFVDDPEDKVPLGPISVK